MINKVVLVVIGILYFIVLNSCRTAVKNGQEASVVGDWELNKTKDSYTGKWVVSKQEEVFCFLSEGKFKKYDKYAKLCVGSYLLKDSLFTVKHDCNASELSYKLETLSKKNLLLSTVGRHGKVFYQFVKK